MEKFDSTDIKILKYLAADARMAFSKLAGLLGVSHTMIHKRYQKMMDDGFLRKATLVMDNRVMGYSSVTFTGIVLKEAGYSYKVVSALKNIPEVVECHLVSGKYAILIKVMCKDNDHLREVLYDKVHAIEGVGGTDSFISFGEQWNVDNPLFQDGDLDQAELKK